MTKSVIIDGKNISTIIKNEVIEESKKLIDLGIQPCLAVIIVGNNQASKVYVNNKKKACEYCNIKSLSYELPEETNENDLLELIDELNKSKNVNGILVQLPLPKHINEENIILKISKFKDVDCFNPYNLGCIFTGKEGFKPCTPAGIIELIKRYEYKIEGKNCVVIGRSNIVGKPVSILLMAENGTVTICHSKTKNIKEICKNADIIVVATGKINTLTKDMVKEGAIIIDVGINRNENGKICGDVDFENVKDVAGAITPVPGGVGPMTIAMLMRNCIIATKMQNNII